MNKCFPALLGKAGGERWWQFHAKGNTAGETFFGAWSGDGGIRVPVVYPERGDGEAVGTRREKFCLNQSCSPFGRLRHGRLSGRRLWSEWDFPFPGSG